MLTVAALVIIGSAYSHGILTDRWIPHRSEKLDGYTARLGDLPTEFGDWTSTDAPVDPAQFKASGCDGSFSKLFENSVTGEQISVFLVSGRGYHVTIHTPNFCYVAAGYDMRADPTSYAFVAPGMPDNEVVHTVFSKATPTETSNLRILWTYSTDGSWKSPKLAKYTYGREDAMYKLYVIRNISDGVEIGDDPTVQFAKEFLPILNQTLFPTGLQEQTVTAEAAVPTPEA